MVVSEQRIVRGLSLVLRFTRRASFGDQLHAVEHRPDAEREERLEVQRAGGVVGPDRRLSLQQDRTGIDAGVGPEDRDTAASLAADQLPGDGAAAAIARQE